jgi:hypothetical protein
VADSQSMSNQEAKRLRGPHSSTSSQKALASPPIPMWFGTTSRISPSPSARNAAAMPWKSSAEPSSGLSREGSVTS